MASIEKYAIAQTLFFFSQFFLFLYKITNMFFLLFHTPQYAYGSVNGDGYTGAKANLNVWSPKTENKDEYSLAKISLSSQSGETVEVGWQAC